MKGVGANGADAVPVARPDTVPATGSTTRPDVEGITRARHVLQRTGFAETPARVIAAAREPLDGLLAARLSSAAPVAPIAPPAWVDEPTLSYATFRELEEAPRRAARRRVRQIQNERLRELQAWWLACLIATDNPLGARMTLFWQNHFTSEQRKVRYTELMYRQQLTLTRHATGRFGELLLAVLHDPAMLIYLDNRRSRKGRLNENLARELLELFTLGEGEYAEADIRELARALTGLAVDAELRFAFRRGAHDAAPKTLLGTDGVRGVDDVVDVLLAQPATARHLAGKLWRHFVSPEPDLERVTAHAAVFRDSGHDIAALLGALFADETFTGGATRGTLVKSPVELVVGTHRALGLPPSDPLTLVRAMRALQQPLYEPPNVRGWVGGRHWINSQTLLARRRFVNGLLRHDALDFTRLADGLPPEALSAALLPLAPLTPLPPPVTRKGRASDAGTSPTSDGRRATARALRREPIAHLLRDPIHNLC